MELSSGGLLAGSWSPGSPSHDEELSVFSPISMPHPPEKGEGSEMELIIDCTLVRKPP